ncbi:hypothetical protein J6590_089819 [Homalodisca vitripennis]|nr:hypothetical protein J6590_093618 [Homalodisca vitripennis]KAG8324546.1 hypothetical protein J6590_089819 [Homalodisca vitripennis]
MQVSLSRCYLVRLKAADAKDVDDSHIPGVGYVILLPQVSATTKSRERPRVTSCTPQPRSGRSYSE